MNIVRYRPDTLIDRFFHSDYAVGRSHFHNPVEPRVDVVEHEKEFKLTIELPGVDKKEVKVTVDNGYLSISGEKKSEITEENGTSWRSERHFGSFSRSFRLGRGVSQEKIAADYNDGILTVTVPKSKEAIKKEIEVKIS